MKHQHRPSPAVTAHLNQLLDEALSETFPASDPIAIAVEFESTEETGFYKLWSRAPVGGIHPALRRAHKAGLANNV